MGKYCKAYPILQLRGFSGWIEQAQNARKEKPQEADDGGIEITRTLTDNDFLYLQENYVVTDGIFQDENIIFDKVTPEWIAYCQEKLKFEIPSFAAGAKEPVEASA
ncbi:MAG TPA: hypothetical protein VLG46_02310 [Anaerolineae bacterium]|nr:hypothetical protein [Anaerolineae bacterium]